MSLRNLQLAKTLAFVARVVAVVGLFFSAALSAAPQRIISLSPHLTEAVFWLGAEARLVGRDRFSNYPAAVENIPVVGDAYSINVEALAALKPDLILLWQAPQTLANQLNQMKLTVFNSNPTTLSAVYSELERLAQTLGVSAQSQFTELHGAIKRLESNQQPGNKTKKKALILVQHQPPVALGLGDSLAASLSYCGWENSLQQKQAVVNLSPEFLWAGDFDALINFAGKAEAYQNKPVLQPEVDPLVRPGPRLPTALYQLCTQLQKLN